MKGYSGMGVAWRVVATAAVLLLEAMASPLLSTMGSVGGSQAAARQFESSNEAAMASSIGMAIYSGLGLSALLALLIIAAIWWKPAKQAVGRWLLMLGVAVGGLVVLPDDAMAYYDKTDRTEVAFILPNESAFYIPDVGDNKTSQVAFGSEQYYAQNKIALKRFQIPHVKLPNSAMFSDYYIPAGRLMIVNRKPYAREWTSTATRGSSAKDESVICQSAEGIDVASEIAIATSISEANSAKYLYFFGVEPTKGDRNDPGTVFASVYYARDLASVMDSVVHTKVQALVCNEIGKRGLDAVNRESSAILGAVEESTRRFLADKGITLESFGWAGTFTFNPEIQKAINDNYIAGKLGAAMPVLKQQADIEVKRGLAEGLKKGIPSLLPPVMADWIGKLFGASETAVASRR